MDFWCANNLGNLSLGLHSADLADFGHCADFSLALRPKSAKNHESQTENPSVVDSARNAQNLIKKELCEAPKLARFVVQKIGIKDAVVRPPIFC